MMQIQIESTSKIVKLNGLPARVWEGQTTSGIPIHCYVTRIAVEDGLPPESYEQFERELQECRKPSLAVEAFPASVIL